MSFVMFTCCFSGAHMAGHGKGNNEHVYAVHVQPLDWMTERHFPKWKLFFRKLNNTKLYLIVYQIVHKIREVALLCALLWTKVSTDLFEGLVWLFSMAFPVSLKVLQYFFLIFYLVLYSIVDQWRGILKRYWSISEYQEWQGILIRCQVLSNIHIKLYCL